MRAKGGLLPHNVTCAHTLRTCMLVEKQESPTDTMTLKIARVQRGSFMAEAFFSPAFGSLVALIFIISLQ